MPYAQQVTLLYANPSQCGSVALPLLLMASVPVQAAVSAAHGSKLLAMREVLLSAGQVAGKDSMYRALKAALKLQNGDPNDFRYCGA
jgi:hypothetical protein